MPASETVYQRIGFKIRNKDSFLFLNILLKCWEIDNFTVLFEGKCQFYVKLFTISTHKFTFYERIIIRRISIHWNPWISIRNPAPSKPGSLLEKHIKYQILKIFRHLQYQSLFFFFSALLWLGFSWITLPSFSLSQVDFDGTLSPRAVGGVVKGWLP